MGERTRAAGQVLLTMGLLGMLLAFWAVFIEPRRLVLVEAELASPPWPEELRLRVGLISDIHVGSPGVGAETVERVVGLLNAADPDLVLFLGDFSINEVLGGSPVEPSAWAPTLRRLHPRLGSYAVMGNHDWWTGPPEIRAALDRSGVQTLENEAVPLDVNGRALWLVGIGDHMTGHDHISEALSAVPEGLPILAMTHGPDIFVNMPARVTLLVAGHTHGGQVRLPGFEPWVVPSLFGPRFARGLVVENGHALYVTSGVGTSILPLRFNVPPEVVVLELGGPASTD